MKRRSPIRKTGRKTMAAVGVILTALVLLAAAGLLWAFLARHDFFCPSMRRTHCLGNLDRIAEAKELCRDELGLSAGAPVAEAQVSEFVVGGWESLRCPAGGAYALGEIGKAPTCSLPGHAR